MLKGCKNYQIIDFSEFIETEKGKNLYYQDYLDNKEDYEDYYDYCLQDFWIDNDYIKINGDVYNFYTIADKEKDLVYFIFSDISELDCIDNLDDIIKRFFNNELDSFDNNTRAEFDSTKNAIAYRGGSGYTYDLYYL